MTKSVINCGSLENTVDFAGGDLVKDSEGTIFLITDEGDMVVIYSKTHEVGTAYDPEDWGLHLVPKGLSVTLTQE